MELYKELLIHALAAGEITVTFPDYEIDIEQIIEGKCYKALERIQKILSDDSLDDRECFMRIEEIICALEEVGSGGGFRHDF